MVEKQSAEAFRQGDKPTTLRSKPRWNALMLVTADGLAPGDSAPLPHAHIAKWSNIVDERLKEEDMPPFNKKRISWVRMDMCECGATRRVSFKDGIEVKHRPGRGGEWVDG